MKSTFLIFLSLFFVFASSSSLAMPATPKCTEEFCNAVAIKMPSDKDKADAIEGMNARYGNLEFTLPENPTLVASFWDTGTFVLKYGSDKKIIFGTMKELDSVFITMPKNLTLFDWATIVFTKTTKDSLPESPEDKEAWLWTLGTKEAYFGENEDVFFIKKGSFTAYITSGKNAPYDYGVIITDDKNKDMLIDLSFDKFDFNEIKSILKNMQIKE